MSTHRSERASEAQTIGAGRAALDEASEARELVRLGAHTVWHHPKGAQSVTYCEKPISAQDERKTADGTETICGTCAVRFEFRDVKEHLAAALRLDAAQPVNELKRGQTCTPDYARKVLDELCAEGRAHLCAIQFPHRAKLYRKGSREECPAPARHSRR